MKTGKRWRSKEGSIPTIGAEYRELKKWEKNCQEQIWENGKKWYDYITDIDYKGYKINLVEYGEIKEHICKKGRKKGNVKLLRKEFWYLTDLPVTRKNVDDLIEQQKHRRLLESMKETSLKEYMEEIDRKIQIRFI